jgi:hypothetical protein
VTMKTFSLSLYLEGVAAVRSEGGGSKEMGVTLKGGSTQRLKHTFSCHFRTLSDIKFLFFVCVYPSLDGEMRKRERYTKEQTITNEKHTKDQNKVSWIFKKSRKKQNCQPKDRTQRNIQYKLR